MVKDKSLKDKAIVIKGKKYVLVADRVNYFNEVFPNGAIRTYKLDSVDRVEFMATVIPDVANPDRCFTGHSQAVWGDGYINKTSALENAETSAVGRALAFMGIGVIESIASVDEIAKAKNQESVQLVIPGKCSVCGKTAVQSKSGRWYCPDYKSHGRHQVVAEPKELAKEEQKFVDSLPGYEDIPVVKQ